MRVLFATTAGDGHFGPMVPVARALRDAGHEVRVAAPASFAPVVARARLVHAPFDDAPPEAVGAIFAQLPQLSMTDANTMVIRDVFGRIDTRAALPRLRAIVEEWRPHVIVREPAELSSYVVAHEAGIPQLQVAIGLGSLEELMLPIMDQPLREHGCAGGAEGLYTVGRLTSVPERLDTARAREPLVLHRFHGVETGDLARALPPWWSDDAQPLIYVSFGSVTASIPMFGDLYVRVVAALADVHARVLLTVGEAGDPAALGPVPPNIHVEKWWPQQDVMPHASAMVGHGGFGTTLLGLAYGLPMVVVPLFASDQFLNAARVQAVGAGIAMEDGVDALGSLADAVHTVLHDPSYATAAHQIADDIASLPPAASCVRLIEQVAAE